jgi:hypothetical protein
MSDNITKKSCRQHVANCCLGVRPPLQDGKWPITNQQRELNIKSNG